jgi:hypothetical protein
MVRGHLFEKLLQNVGKIEGMTYLLSYIGTKIMFPEGYFTI